MNTAERIRLIGLVTKAHKDYNVVVDAMQVVYGNGAGFDDGLLSELLEAQQETIVQLVSELSGIASEAIYWHIYENDCGAKGYACEFKDVTYNITNDAEFVAFEEVSKGLSQ